MPCSQVAMETALDGTASPYPLSCIYCNLLRILVSLQGVGLATEQHRKDDPKQSWAQGSEVEGPVQDKFGRGSVTDR